MKNTIRVDEPFLYTKLLGNSLDFPRKMRKLGILMVFPQSRSYSGKPSGSPEYDPDTVYIVSAFVKSALPDRADLVVPSDPVRDPDGRIIGCRAFGV